MKILYLIFLVQSVFAQYNFGTSYLKNSRLCHQWTCLNNKLGLPDTLPAREQYTEVLKSLLPSGPWHQVVETVVNVCYGNRPRRYTNTCPGQALMHCAVENLVENCPENYWRKGDACAPVSTLAGFKYLFSQSRYQNLDLYLPKEIRPSWFLKNYFNKRCCDLPELFNSTVLQECGVTTFMHYYNHEPRDKTVSSFKPITTASQRRSENAETTTKSSFVSTSEKLQPHMVDLPMPGDGQKKEVDPFSCCDISGFINRSMREECDFHLTVDDDYRFVVKNATVTTTEPTKVKRKISNDVKVVPVSCDKEACVFRKLNIISEDGSVNMEAFSMLLHNFTYNYPEWTRAKARVVTKCLSKPIKEYPADCEINTVLGCVFDVLSENCPHAKKMDPCKHTTTSGGKNMCQINSSKFRPKNRRLYCGLPSLVNHQVLSECGMASVSRLEYVLEPAVTVKPEQRKWLHFHSWCKESPQPMTCLMEKMGVINKFNFLDYFKMKDYLKSFTHSRSEWSALSDVYVNMFMQSPLYNGYCSSPRKMLNVLHSMISTCPMERRSNTQECQNFFLELSENQNVTEMKRTNFRTYIPHVNLPSFKFDGSFLEGKKPLDLFSIKPATLSKRPLVILPVYLRYNLTRPIPNDGVWRSGPVSFYN